MDVEDNRTEHADYGLDAPWAVRNATLAGSACGLLALLAYALLRPRRRTLAALVLGACAGLSCIVFAGSTLWSSGGRVSLRANRRNP